MPTSLYVKDSIIKCKLCQEQTMLASAVSFGPGFPWLGFNQESSPLAKPEYHWGSNGLISSLLLNVKKRWAPTHRRGCKVNIKYKKNAWTLLFTLFQSAFQNFVGTDSILFLAFRCQGGKEYVHVVLMCALNHLILEELNVCFQSTIFDQKSTFYLGKSGH